MGREYRGGPGADVPHRGVVGGRVRERAPVV